MAFFTYTQLEHVDQNSCPPQALIELSPRYKSSHYDEAWLMLLCFDTAQNQSDIIVISNSLYQVNWVNLLTYVDGDYDITVEMFKICDLAGNSGIGIDTTSWTVNRTTNLTISNLAISPDLGFSSVDFITSSRSVKVA